MSILSIFGIYFDDPVLQKTRLSPNSIFPSLEITSQFLTSFLSNPNKTFTLEKSRYCEIDLDKMKKISFSRFSRRDVSSADILDNSAILSSRKFTFSGSALASDSQVAGTL